MMTLIQGGEVFAPECLGTRDILLAGGRIVKMDSHLELGESLRQIRRIDAADKFVVPGFIDSHVHILGGGGEGSFKTRTPEITLTDLTTAGVTTVVGCLGTDGFSRSLLSLVAKARALEEEGISTYLYTGSYQVPVKTISGRIEEDLLLIDKCIGVGEIAISDHRSSQPTLEDITRVAAAARVGGMLSGKAGIVNVHVGDGARKLQYLEQIIDTSEIPRTQFLPTHINRNQDLFAAGIQYAKRGGYVDLTTSSSSSRREASDNRVTCSHGLKRLLDAGVPRENVTFSSDGQGSLPRFNERGEYCGLGIGRCDSLWREARAAIVDEGIDLATALRVVTSNPARILKLSSKGHIREAADADLVLLEKETLKIDTVIAGGKVMVLNEEIIHKGTFE